MTNTLTAPPSVIASWPQPDYEDPQTKGLALEYVSIAFGAFGLLIVLLRCYSRIYLTRAFGFDDAFIIIALLLFIALSVLLIYGIRHWYLGYHIWDLSAEMVVKHRHGMWIASFVCICCSCTIRISILLCYHRLSVSLTRWFLIASWLGIAYNVCLIISLCLVNAFICWPTQAYWLRYNLVWRTSHQWKCGNEGISLPVSGALTIVGDIYCAILLLVLVVTLKIPPKQRIALYCLFSLGFLACGAGTARVTILSLSVLTTYDFTWMIYDMWIWNTVELFAGVFAACAPALGPVLRQILGRDFLGDTYQYESRRYGTNGSQSIASYKIRDAGHTAPNSREWNDLVGTWKSPVPTVTSFFRSDERVSNGRNKEAVTGTSSFVSTRGSLDHDHTSAESFPIHKSKYIRPREPASPIPEEASEFSGQVPPEIEVDPPIYPAIAVVKRISKPTRASQFVGDGLPQPETKRSSHPIKPPPTSAQDTDDNLSGLSSPAPLAGQCLSNQGWVEIRPTKNACDRGSASSIPGSVKAARLRAGAQNESRILAPSPSESQKPYYDAESSHNAGFIPTPLPRTIYSETRLSDDVTRLDYSTSSGEGSVKDLSQFQFELHNDSSVTALPRHRERR